MKSQSGFTLIEVIISLVILAIGLMGLLGMSTMTIRASAENDQWTTARMIATSYAEEITSKPLSEVQNDFLANPVGGPVTVTRNGHDYTVNWWLRQMGTSTDPVQVSVQVRYSDFQYQRPVSITTLRGFFL